MPSGPKKRKAAKNRQKREANVIIQTNSQDDVKCSTVSISTSVEAAISVTETIDGVALAKPVVSSSDDASNIDNIVSEDGVLLGLKENEQKVFPLSDSNILDILYEEDPKLIENVEVLTSLNENAGAASILMVPESEENEGKLLQSPNSPGVETITGKDQLIPACPLLCDHNSSTSHEAITTINRNAGIDSTSMGTGSGENIGNLETTTGKELIIHACPLILDPDPSASREIMIALKGKSGKDSTSISTGSEVNEGNLLQTPDSPSVETHSGIEQIIFDCQSETDEFLSSLNENASLNSTLLISGSEEKKENLLQAIVASNVESGIGTEKELDSKNESPESRSFSPEIVSLCPLHCSVFQLFGSKLIIETKGEEKNAGDSCKNVSSAEHLEHIKKIVEAELHVADNMGLLLRKLLEDLNAIEVPQVPN